MKAAILKLHLVFLLGLLTLPVFAQVKIGLLKYGGGGDWYANPTSLPNLAEFLAKETGLKVFPRIETVEATSPGLFSFQVLHTTGHGNLKFTDEERTQLRRYLLNGGFLHVDDNYGLAPYFKKEVERLFPEFELTPIPRSYGLFNAWYSFPEGLPKIHEHDGKAPQAYGIFHNNRLILLFTTECDLGDGWEDAEVHKNPEDLRRKALQMGVNIVVWALNQ